MKTTSKQYKLQLAYEAFRDKYGSNFGAFATGTGIDYDDATVIITLGKKLLQAVESRKNDDRYAVAYERLGPDMHNYRLRFNGKGVGYALSEDEAWVMCQEHFVDSLIGKIAFG